MIIAQVCLRLATIKGHAICLTLSFNKNPPIHSQQIRILHKTNKKKTFWVNCWPSGKYVHLLFMYSIHGRGSFRFNYCLNSAWHGGDQFVALLRWYGSPGFFDSDLQLICIFWFLVSNFPLDYTPLILYGVQIWWVCWPVKHTNTMVI